MKKRTKRAAARSRLKAAREAGQKRPGGSSNYAKKHKFLAAHGGSGLDYPDRPWRSS